MRQFIQLIILNNEKTHLLAVKRAKSDSSFGGMWSLPGGEINDGETVDLAAKRELKEETNLEIANLSSESLFEISPILKGSQIRLTVKSASVQPGDLMPNDKDIETISWITPKKLVASFITFGIPIDVISKFQSKLALFNNK